MLELSLLLKLVHVVGAILWVGGMTVMTVVILQFDRKGDDKALLTALSHMGLAAQRVFMPLSHVVLVSGALLAWVAGWGLSAWVVLAALLVAVFAPFGILVMGPVFGRAIGLWEGKGDIAGAAPVARKALRLAKVDLAGQFAIVSLMVLKPGWTDPLLLVPALVLALGALAYHRGAAAPAAAQPA